MVTNVVTVLPIHKIVIGSKVVFVKLDGVAPPVLQILMNVVQLISVELWKIVRTLLDPMNVCVKLDMKSQLMERVKVSNLVT